MKQKEGKEKSGTWLLQLKKLGGRYNMVFTSYEVLPQRIIGLDGIMQKILVLETGDKSIDWYLIDLKEVASCSLKTIPKNQTSSIQEEGIGKDQIENIALEFTFKRGVQTVVIPFYEAQKNTIMDLPDLNSKACYWEALLGQMVVTEEKGLNHAVVK